VVGYREAVNTNDILPHAFQVNHLDAVPELYGDRSRGLQAPVDDMIGGVRKFDYRHSKQGVRTFNGRLDNHRAFAVEMIYQHVDAYLEDSGLFSDTMNAFTCFV
jgi:hypothetical protein